MMMKSKGKIIAYSYPLEQQANNLTFERGTIKMNEKKGSNEVDQPLQDEFNKKGMDRRSFLGKTTKLAGVALGASLVVLLMDCQLVLLQVLPLCSQKERHQI